MGDSDKGDRRCAMSRQRTRSGCTLAGHNWSSWGKSDRSPEREARARSDRSGRTRWRGSSWDSPTSSAAISPLAGPILEFTRCGDHLGDHLFIHRSRSPLAGNQDHVDPSGQLLCVATERLSNEALDSISDVRTSHLSTHRHPHSNRAAAVSSRKDDEMGGHHSIAGALNR